jgi:DNA polymerase/3'-5' exonuclease PolX
MTNRRIAEIMEEVAGLLEEEHADAHRIRSWRLAAQTLREQMNDVFRTGRRSPAERFARLPGVGPELGERIHQDLGIATLEELEQAAHDGSLETVPGFGPRRVAAIIGALRGRRATGATP